MKGWGHSKMTTVSDFLRNRIGRLVDDHKIVVWFDPESHYGAFAATLALPETMIARYDGSFFALRRQVDHLLDGDEAPRLLVYVPLAENATQDALVELTAIGAVLKPGQQPWQRNSGLAVITRAALKNTFSEEQLNVLGKQIESGQLASLEDVEETVERTGDVIAPGVLTLIFGTSVPEEIALAFLASDQLDGKIVEREAFTDLTELLRQTFGAAMAPRSLQELRQSTARHILCTDLLTTLHDPIPPQLKSVTIAADTGTREACQRLARRWRQDLDRADAYAQHAALIERELALPQTPLTLDQIGECETFAAIEGAAERNVAKAWLEAPSARLLETGERRKRGFWARRDPQALKRWDIMASAGQLLLHAGAIEARLHDARLTVSALASLYINGETDGEAPWPWCDFDTLHRELEQRSQALEFTDADDALTQLIAQARRRYSDVSDQLATRFTHALEAGGLRLPELLPELPQQRDLFARVVAPAVREAKTAYVLVDALRYEMARDLARGLEASFEVTLDAAIASVPTITEIGMASLMPAVADGVIVPGGPGKLALRVGDTGNAGNTLLRDRATRLEWLKSHAPIAPGGAVARTLTLSLDDLQQAPKPPLKTQLANADLIVVTSQEIDKLGEGDNISLARTLMNTLLDHLTRGIRRLAEYGCGRVIVVADHGYLFGEELDSAMKIDPPGGQQVDLHRRVWVGRGGAANPAYLRARLDAFCPCEDDLELATPWGLGAFRTPGGARAYFHGGLSPQELLIPVMKLVPLAKQPEADAGIINWTLTPGSSRITTRLYTVTISGQRGLFETTIPPVRIEVRSGSQVISALRFADYGLNETTQELQLRFSAGDTTQLEPCLVALEIDPEQAQGERVSAHLLDARTGRELTRLDAIELRIGIN